MSDDALLSDLCSICNTTKSKYRCPGCAARTCSLPCYKRHQQWAQCSGKRDPTKYVRKSQLATPAGIDHDFNFLTSVERGLERSEKHVNDRGLGTPSALRRDREPAVGHFAAAGVEVIPAPKGLSRSKENTTHRSKKGTNIIWTIEWIISQDKTRVLTEGSSALPIRELQPFYRNTKKRKRGADHPQLTKLATTEDATNPPPGEVEGPEIKAEDEKSKLPSPGRGFGAAKGTKEQGHHNGDGGAGRSNDDHAQVEAASHPSPALNSPDPEPLPPQYSFYLLRPRTSSNRHVLIPLSTTATLAECLRGRTVLEFPTIYAFPGSTSPAADEFMLEEEYIKQEGEEQKEFDELMMNVSPETLRALKQEGEQNTGEGIDSTKILDVLKQDIGGAGL